MKVFVDWPIFSRNSNGIVCLYELSLFLHKAGFSVYGVPRKFQTFLHTVANLPDKYSQIQYVERPSGSASDFFVVSETVSRSMIDHARMQQIRIAWWALAPYRLLDGALLPKIGDFSLPYSSYVDPTSEHFLYFQPDLDNHFVDALDNQKSRVPCDRMRIAVYTGKGRIKALPQPVLDICKGSEIFPITRTTPPIRFQLFDLLSSVDCMITFDELSAINLEAAALGVPVLLANPLFPPLCRQAFSVSRLKERVVCDVEEFLCLVSLRRQNKLKSWIPDDLLRFNHSTLASWVDLLTAAHMSERYEVKKESIIRFRDYTQSLSSKRVISFHNGGQAGGAWLASRFIAKISTGGRSPALMILIRTLDCLYLYFWPFLLFMERLPGVRNIFTKRRKISYSYILGKRVARL